MAIRSKYKYEYFEHKKVDKLMEENIMRKEKILKMEKDIMSTFADTCRGIIVKDYNDLFGKRINKEDIFMVWCCKTLQNCKAIFTTNVCGDGVIIECTLNGCQHEIYTDIYVKKNNSCTSLDF